MNRRHQSFTVLQATQDSPTLARLTSLATESSTRLELIQALIPLGMRPSVRPGPIEGAVWCLILDNNSIASKIRQLLPAFESHLRAKGCDVSAIRVKVVKQHTNA
ncbi:MAG TPA: hypothetical protein PKH72_12750 [Rhodoferax sp.]|nr:hypothetical protein [Rhodoferax sp.]